MYYAASRVWLEKIDLSSPLHYGNFCSELEKIVGLYADVSALFSEQN